MNSGRVIIPVNRNLKGYLVYKRIIEPYLTVFGIPFLEYTEDDFSRLKELNAAAVILAQPELRLSGFASELILRAVNSGAGLIDFASSSLHAPGFSELLYQTDDKKCALSEICIHANHYITALHKSSEQIPLYSEIMHTESFRLKNGIPLAESDGMCVMEVSRFGEGNIVLWHTMEWCSHSVLGKLHGMDDLVWRCIVWAAKKPFVMQGMPRFIGMRVDDVWGAWRNITPDNPLSWVDIANNYNIKPWLGVFQDNINNKATAKLKALADAGLATAFPHAFSGCEWVGSPIPENFIYFDHFNSSPYSDSEIKRNTSRAKAWFDDKHIPISKVALPHYYEMGENALEYIIDWGCEFTGTHMVPDNPYSGSAWIHGAPYRMLENGKASSPRPVYYADYLKFDNPKISGKLYNLVVEIRDVCGYEWAPTTDTESTIRNGITQLKRSFDSLVPGFLFTHESKFIQRMLPSGFEASISGITAALAGYNPCYETADNIYRYVRARNNVRITDVMLNGNNITITLHGNNDIETKCMVFSGEDEGITEAWITIPVVTERVEVTL